MRVNLANMVLRAGSALSLLAGAVALEKYPSVAQFLAIVAILFHLWAIER